jgi:hypothetical protein
VDNVHHDSREDANKNAAMEHNRRVVKTVLARKFNREDRTRASNLNENIFSEKISNLAIIAIDQSVTGYLYH